MAISMLMTENIVKTEAFFKAAMQKSIMTQATALKELSHAAKEARREGDAAKLEAIELKMKEIILSQAAVWNRMSPDHQNMVMKEIPPEADWWVAIAAAENLKADAVKPDRPASQKRNQGWDTRDS